MTKEELPELLVPVGENLLSQESINFSDPSRPVGSWSVPSLVVAL